MAVLHYLSSLLMWQVFSTTVSSEADPMNIQGNVVYDKLKKNIYMTFQGPNLSNAIRTLIDQTQGHDTPENSSERTNSSSQRYQNNTKQILGTSIQDLVSNTQKASKANQHQENTNVFNKSPVQHSARKAGSMQSKWHTFDAITSGKQPFVDKNFQGASAGLPTTNKDDVAASVAVNRYQKGPGIDQKNSLKTLHGILTDNFGEPLFGTESESNFGMAALRAHNRYRKIHTCPPLRLNQELSREAEAQAALLAGLGQVVRDKQNPLGNSSKGENVARFCGDVGLTASGAVKRWYDEVCSYNWDSKEVFPNTRRFRQLICKNSTELGIGRAKGFINGQTCTYIIAYYRPVPMSKELTCDGKIEKGLFVQSYCQGKRIYAGNKVKQPETKEKTHNNTNAHYPNHQQNLQRVQDEPTLQRNGPIHQKKGINSLQQMMSKNNDGANDTIKSSDVIIKNTTKHATNGTGKAGSPLGVDATVEVLANETHTSLDSLEEQYGHTHNKSHNYSQVMEQRHTSKVEKPTSSHDERPGLLHISAVNDSELLDEDPIESWSNSETSPNTPRSDHLHDTTPEQSSFAIPSEDVSQYGNTISQIQPLVPEATLNDLDYSTGQIKEHHHSKRPMEPNNRHFLDIDATGNENEVQDVALSDTLTQKDPSSTRHYKGEDDLPPKLYQQMQNSFNRVDDQGIDEYQPQDDFTVTMEPDHDREFSDGSDYESIDENSLFNSYMIHRNGHKKWREV